MSTLVGQFEIAKTNIWRVVSVWYEAGKTPEVWVEEYGSPHGTSYNEPRMRHRNSAEKLDDNPRVPAYVKKEIFRRLKHGCTHIRDAKGNCLVGCGKEFSRNIRTGCKPFELPEVTGIIPYGNLSVGD